MAGGAGEKERGELKTRGGVFQCQKKTTLKNCAHKEVHELLKERLISIRAPVLIRFCFLDSRNLQNGSLSVNKGGVKAKPE